MSAPTPSPEVNVEILKLLLQAAWANDTLAPKEREAVVTLGNRWKVPPDTLLWLLRHLDEGKPLPQPNLGLLRAHREAALAAAERFVGVDGVVDDAEKDFLVTVDQLLGA